MIEIIIATLGKYKGGLAALKINLLFSFK